MICTVSQFLEALEYYIGYCEKASETYSKYRDKEYFEKDKGTNNYTYFGHKLGYNGQAWCATFITQAMVEACGGSEADAKIVLHGVFPYASVIQLYDGAPSAYKGRAGSFTPQAGDIVVYHDGKEYRTHTGVIYAVKNGYIYTIEGNVSDVVQKRSYLLTNTNYIYGYVRPKFAASDGEYITTIEQYGKEIDVTVHQLSKGVAGPEVKTLQRILYAQGILDEEGNPIDIDGDFGNHTEYCTIVMQGILGLVQDGIVGEKTWNAMLTTYE